MLRLRRRLLWTTAVAAVALLFSACQSPRSSGAAKDTIVQLNVITVPMALDLDGRPGPDGVAVKLYANEAQKPKAIRIRGGTLELLMFDGTFFGRTNVPPPLRTFRFSGAELRTREFKSNIGYGYEFSLPWGTNRPSQRIMGVAARYTASDGRVITSRPSSVTVLEK